MNGILLIDKHVGISSFGIVAKVKRTIREQTGQKVKIGHTGTLDPLASGLLILVLGSYTKRASEFSKLDKTYEVELTLGATSVTGDAEGPITPTKNVNSYQIERSFKKVTEALNSFVGEIQQTPHAHSAIKVGGQRAYKLARAGKTPKIEPRKVTIYSIENVRYKYPKLSFVTEVSSGTYIRSLAQDIGEKLGTGAYVSALRRTKIGSFAIQDSFRLAEFDINKLKTSLVKS